jgi:hypothetical protein
VTLREAAEDLRDGAAKLVAAVIAERHEDALYIFHALITESFKDVAREVYASSPRSRGQARNDRA